MKCCSDALRTDRVPRCQLRLLRIDDILKQIPVLPSSITTPYTAPRFPELLVVTLYAVDLRCRFIPCVALGVMCLWCRAGEKSVSGGSGCDVDYGPRTTGKIVTPTHN